MSKKTKQETFDNTVIAGKGGIVFYISVLRKRLNDVEASLRVLDYNLDDFYKNADAQDQVKFGLNNVRKIIETGTYLDGVVLQQFFNLESDICRQERKDNGEKEFWEIEDNTPANT